MELLINEVPRSYYYKESVRETPLIIDNIINAPLQELYREFMSKYRNIGKDTLKENCMFYILDGYEELDEIIPSLYTRDLLGIQVGDFVKQKERFVFPLMDSFKTIIGWVGYDYDEPQYKYLMTFSKFADKGNLFFNMQNINKAYEEDVCIVEEGVFDSLRLNEIGYKNNLALLGKRMTDFHKRVLNRFSLVIIISDNDDEGLKSSNIWAEMLDTRVAHIYINKHEIDKQIYDPETEETKTVKVITKDIDDYLSVESNRKNFHKMYKRIIKDSKNTLSMLNRYSL